MRSSCTLRIVCAVLAGVLLFFLLPTVGTGTHGSDLPGAATSHPWAVEHIPDPTKDPVGCGRPAGRKSWICDPDRLLSPGGADAVELALQEIHANATRKCGDIVQGYEVAVGIVRWMVTGGEHVPEATRRFARELHNRWGVGAAECDNGVVMFLSVEDRWVYISTGKGSREALPDSGVQHAISVMRPLLRSGNLDKAVLAGVKDIDTRLRQPIERWGLLQWLIFGPFLLVSAVLSNPLLLFCVVVGAVGLWMLFTEVRERAQRAKFRRRLMAIEEQRAAARAGQFAATSCPICLEDYEPEGSPSRKPTRLLRCGHVFHEECIHTWESSGRSTAQCPICRGPINAPATAVGSPHKQCFPTTVAEGRATQTFMENETSFRLRRLRDLYPALLVEEQIRHWARPDYTGTFDW
eukprot:RCo026693